MAESIVFMVLVGVGGLLTITATTYAMAFVTDRLCSSNYPTERVFSPVSNAANLWGMGYKERVEVLEQLFREKKTMLRQFAESEFLTLAFLLVRRCADIRRWRSVEDDLEPLVAKRRAA